MTERVREGAEVGSKTDKVAIGNATVVEVLPILVALDFQHS